MNFFSSYTKPCLGGNAYITHFLFFLSSLFSFWEKQASSLSLNFTVDWFMTCNATATKILATLPLQG